MAIFGNFKGTTQPSFTIGKRGPAIFGTPSDGSLGDPTSPLQGDFWFDPANNQVKIYSNVSSSLAWRSIGAHLSDLNVDNGTLFVDTANDTVSVGSTSSNEKLFVNGSLRLGTNPAIKYSGAYLDLQHANGSGTVIRVKDNTGNTNPVFKVYNANNTADVFKVDGNSITIADSYILPTADGINGQAIVTDGNGNLSFASVSSLVPAVGNNTEIQFNDGGTFGASADLTFNKSTNQLYLNGTLAVDDIAFNNGASISTAAGNSNVDVTAGPGGYVALTSNNSNTSIWAENDAAYVATNFTGSVKLWEFSNTGNLTLPGGSKVAINSSNVDIYAGVNGYAALTSNDANTTMWAENDGSYIVTHFNGSQNIWEFANSGDTAVPGNVVFSNTGKILVQPGGVDLISGTGGYAGITSHDGNTTMWVEDSPNSAYIATAYNGTQHVWEFDQSGNLTLPGNLNANTHKIVNVVDPTDDQDAATKKYVDDQLTGTSGTGVVTGVIFVPITDYGSVADTANMTIDFGSISDPASYKTSYEYILETNGILHDSYTVSTLPNPGVPGQMIYVSNDVGGPTMAFSDGSSWRRIQDRAIVS